jgi:P27 family predicted phage terminase small subunit
VVPLLYGSGTVTSVDTDVLAHYCEVVARYEEAQAKLAGTALLVMSPNGHLIQNPLLPIVNKCLQQIHRLQGELGMTPSSRSRIDVGAPRDPDEAFLFGGGD